MTVRERPEIVVHDRSNNMIVAFAAVGVLMVIALLGIAAIVGATYVLSNNYNNPPTSQPAPTVAPPPTEQPLIPLPGGDLLPNSAGAG